MDLLGGSETKKSQGGARRDKNIKGTLPVLSSSLDGDK